MKPKIISEKYLSDNIRDIVVAAIDAADFGLDASGNDDAAPCLQKLILSSRKITYHKNSKSPKFRENPNNFA